MLIFVLTVVAAGAALIGFLGLIYGVTGRGDARRAFGLRLIQSGMAIAGLSMIGASVAGGEGDYAIYGLLLLVLGTGVTAISPRASKSG